MKTKALIIGGGAPGLSLGILLAEAGLDTALVELRDLPKGKLPAPGTRTAALMDSSINIVKACGVWDDIKDLISPLKTLSIIDDSSSNIDPLRIDFQAKEAGLDAFGYNVPNNILHSALSNKASKTKNLQLFAPARVTDIQTDPHVIVTLEDGQAIEADILIGADGRGSIVRKQAGIETTIEDYGQSAITCLLSHTKEHHDNSVEHHRPGGPFTFVPMKGKQSALVWVEKTEDAKKYLSLKKAELVQTIQDKSNGLLGKITLASDPESWPLKLLYAKHLTAQRTALVAEAAHVMSPIGAQGLNLSLRDVAALAEELIDAARLGQDIGSDAVLRKYEKRRRIDLTSRIYGVDTFNKVVSNNLVFLRGFRRAGLRTLDAIPPLKKLAMHQGLVPALDDARLLRGETL